ncbi:MAG: hypothetical protein JWN76_3225 [Chitinophagaceae bacterium]|nr:hypothetical protein [Chitinophagaceae bacterium]
MAGLLFKKIKNSNDIHQLPYKLDPMKKNFTLTFFLLLLITLFNGNLQAQSAGALKFDPSLAPGDNSRLNYVSIDHPLRVFQKEITVEYWMYVPNAKLPFGSVMGQSTNNDGTNTVWLMHPNTDGTMTFFVNDGNITLRSATINIIAGSWHHYAGVANATSTKFYVDGALMATGPGISTSILENPSSVIHIGKDVRFATFFEGNNDPFNRYATMTMDEVRIWSRALCQDEIQKTMNCEAVAQTGLEGLYHFNQGIAEGNNAGGPGVPAVNTLTDASGHGRHGVLNNFTLSGSASNWVASGSTNTGTCSPYIPPSAPITGTTSACIGGSRTLSNANTGGTWSSDNGAVATINSTTGVVTAHAAGTAKISYKIAECNAVSTVTFTVNALPVVTASDAGAGCAGDQIELYSSPGVSYAWTGPNSFHSTEQNPIILNGTAANAGVYTVTVTNSNGCSASATTTVAVNPLPLISAGSNSPVCQGFTLNLTSSGGVSYVWTGPNSFSSITANPSLNNVTAAAAGTYTVKGTGANGCRNDASVVVSINTLDSDGDGIPDACDDDADNDGILNVLETNKSNFFWSSTPTVSGKTATGTINGIGYTYTSSSNVLTTGNMFSHSTFPASYGVPNANPTIQNTAVTDNTLTFASPMTNPVLVFASIGQGGLPVPITFSAPVQIVFSQAVVQNSPTQITGTEGYVIVRMMGTFSSISFHYLTAENYCNFAFGADFQGDTDGDGIPDYLDTDSDNDGCPDAIEGSMSFSMSQTSNGRLTGGVDSHGIPLLAGTGQGIGTSENFVVNCFCQPGLDETNPVAIAKNITVNLTAAGNATITAAQINNGSTDNCAIASMVVSKTSFNCSDLGVNPVILTVTDNQGNVSTADATVTVVDNIRPAISCPSNQVLNLDADCNATLPDYRNFVTASDNCTASNALVITQNPAAGTIVSSTGTMTVTFIVTDASANSSTCTITVNKKDVTAPVILCPANQILDLDKNCNATLPDYRSLLRVSENCTASDALVISQSPAAGTVVSTKGALIVTFTVTDASNNTSSCTITVDKKDVTAPVINCPVSVTRNNTTNLCGTAVIYTRPTATDNCSGSAFNFFNGGEPNDANAAHEDYLQLFTNGTWNDLPQANLNRSIVEFNSIISTVFANYNLIGTFGGHTYYISTGTASWNNSRTAAQAIGGDLASINTLAEDNFLAPHGGNVWVGAFHDHTDPSYVEPGDATQNFGGWKWVDGTKLGAGQITITQTAGLASGSTFPVGVTTNTFTATDESGNSSTCSFTVTVVDNQPPVINCPGNIAVIASAANGAVVNYSAPVATDNCSVTTEMIAGKESGSIFPIGVTTVTYRATDPSGNYTDCSFTVTVTGVAPVISCPENITVTNAPGQCGAAVNFSASETTAIPASVITYSIAPGSLFAVGTTAVTAKATNAIGSSSCTFYVTVADNEVPVINRVANISVNNDRSRCGAAVNVTPPTATDNCDVASIIGVRNDELSLTDNYPVGTTTITWTVTDIHSNTTTSTQTIIVTDNEAPVITHSGDVNTHSDAGNCSAAVQASASATDNCGVGAPSGVRNDGKLLTDPYPVGTTTITWTVTDIHNNTSTSTQTIIVTDNEAPKANCQPVTITLVNGAASITAGDVNNHSTDNCGIESVTISKSSFTCANIGANEVTLTVKDIHGNESTCTAIVTVTGEIPTSTITSVPTNNTYTGGNPLNIYLGYGAQSTTLKVTPASNGAPYTYSWTANSSAALAMLSNNTSGSPVFTPAVAGVYTFTVVTTNKYGCTTVASITLCVKDIRVAGTNGSKVYICHQQGGSTPNVLSISINAVASHLANHNDKLGMCDQACGTAPVVRVNNDEPKEKTLVVPKPATTGIAATSQTPELFARELKGTVPSMRITPVPNNGVFNVQLLNYPAGKAEIRIMDMNSKIIAVRSVEIGKVNTFNFNLANKAAGTYFITVMGQESVLSGKVIIQR